MKIAMIGGKTSTIGFKALGVETFDVPKPQDATEVFGGVRPSRYAIIFMTEPVYEVLRSEVEELRDERLPVQWWRRRSAPTYSYGSNFRSRGRDSGTRQGARVCQRNKVRGE